MHRIVTLLSALCLAACSTIPSTGPLRYELVDQANEGGQHRFDIVTIDDRVVNTLLAQPQPPFRERFKKYAPPPELPIAIGDVLAVTVWESSADGLFGRSLQVKVPTASELAAKLDNAGIALSPERRQTSVLAQLKATAQGQSLLQSIEPTGRSGTLIPEQQVGPDGAISVPYAGRVRVAGRTASAVQHAIERLLAGKALDPQVLVVIKSSDANAVTVSGELVAGARVPLAPGGTRLLQVIAAAGGTHAPIRDTFVRLSRAGVTATIPLETLIANPDEDIFARPGDIVTLVGRPQIITVFGATGRNSAVKFDADRVSLSEALAKAGGLADDRADPQAVFLLRYEKTALVKALGERGLGPGDGWSPIAYRLDLADVRSYHLAQRFSLRDKDIIYVANAEVTPLEKVLNVFSTITAPVTSTYILCTSGEVRC